MSKFIFKDLELYESQAVSGSAAAYKTTGIDLGSATAAESGDYELVIKLTYSSGTFNFVLEGEEDATIDASSNTIYTLPAKTASGTFHLPIPKDFGYRYVGWSVNAVAHAGTVESWVQPISGK